MLHSYRRSLFLVLLFSYTWKLNLLVSRACPILILWILWIQVHKRIQKAYGSRDRSRVDTLDDMGFCLFPILDGGSGGSGLAFCGGTSEEDEHSGQNRGAPTRCYSFTPLEAPHGIIRIKVTYRQGVDSKVRRKGPIWQLCLA